MNHLKLPNRNNNKTNNFKKIKDILQDILNKHNLYFLKYVTFLSTMASIGFVLTNLLFQYYLTSYDISGDSIDSYKIIVSSILLGLLVFLSLSIVVYINSMYFNSLKDIDIGKYWVIGVFRWFCFMGLSLGFIIMFPNIEVIYFISILLIVCFSLGLFIYKSVDAKKIESTFFLSADIFFLAYLFFHIQSLTSMEGDLVLYVTIIVFLIIYSLPFIMKKLDKHMEMKFFIYVSIIFNFLLIFMLSFAKFSNILVYWMGMGNSYHEQIVISDEKCNFINKTFVKYECKNNRLTHIYVIWKNGKYFTLQDENKKLIPIKIRRSDIFLISKSFQKHPDKRTYMTENKK